MNSNDIFNKKVIPIMDKVMKDLKATGAIVSPVRCKWEPTK